MASTRKTRKVHKKFAKINEEWPEKEGPSTSNKSKNKKRKLVDLLGPQWSKEELECFYDAYRKFGKDWKKVCGSLRNRTPDMVEALYNMNRAYLSLPEGAATAAGLIAMMSDHYSHLAGSNSDNESDESPKKAPGKPATKRGKGKQKAESKTSKSRYIDLLSCEPASSSFADLSALKKKRSGGTRPRAVGKRTPRVPVASIKNRNSLDSPSMAEKEEDDEGAHVAAMALAEVFQRGGSPQVAHTPSRRAATVKAGAKKNADSERDSSKAVTFHAEGEGSLGSREAENEDFFKSPYTPGKGVASPSRKTGPKSKKSQKRKPKDTGANRSEDDKEACSGTEEGHNSSSRKGLKDADDEDAKSPWASTSSRKRNRQLFFGDDEAGALSALHTLADLSVNILQPTPISESESSAQGKDDNKEIDSKEKQSKPKASTKKEKRKADGAGPDGGARKRAKTVKESATPDTKDSTVRPEKGKKRKPTPSKMIKDEAKIEMARGDVEKAKVPVEDEKAASSKGRRASQASPVSKPADGFVNQLELSPSISGPTRVVIDVSETSHSGNPLQTKSRSRRKSGIVKAFSKRESLRNEITANKRPAYLPNSAVDLKEKLSHCLSNSLFRRWCRFEWFYSAIDYPWFAQNEFVEYLNHVKLGHIPRLTREEWGVIRGSLGKPRRLSAYFLKEERMKLAKYRESVRDHYSSLLTGKLEGLPSDLARPLTVGQRVIACHSKSRELHDGSVLTVVGDRCRVQFDRPELGVEFVLDIDCMPLNPVENMPDALRRQNVYASKFGEHKFVVRANDWRAGALTRVPPNQSSEVLFGPSHTATSHPMSTLLKQAKGDSIDAVAQAKATLNEAAMAARQAMYNQSCTMSQVQEREADIRALAELSRALDKKEALLMELRYMNEEVSGKQKENDTLSDLDHFRNQYATVLVQLREANDQVASALLTLRQRNTYNGNTTNPLLRSTETYGNPSDVLNNAGFINSQDTGTQVVEVIENSRRKAKMMVDAAVQAMCTTNEGEDPAVKIEEALDSLSNRISGSGSSILGIRRIPPDSGHANSTFQQENATSATFDPSAVHAESPKMRLGFEGEVRLPSELISSCVSTLLMIQSCTEKQQPPADVAHILDSALASMQPCCPENAGLYREIETCMGIIKNQMLALIPTPTPSLPIPISLLRPELPPL